MVIFRVDANQYIATGHLMRCISIAQRFVAHGEFVKFLIADNNPAVILEKYGMDYEVLNTKWNVLDYEIVAVKEILQSYNKPLFIIDTYSVTPKYVESLIPYSKCCYLGGAQVYLGKLYALINYSVSVNRDFYAQNYGTDTKLILGPKYMPLREEFMGMHHKTIKTSRCNVLLTTGGSNPNQYIEKILRKIIQSDIFASIEINLILGGMFKNVESIRDEFGRHTNITMYENVESMAKIMSQCDLAITANGSTVYELAACNVPAITFAMAKDQIQSAEKLYTMHMTEYCGVIYDDENSCIEKIVDNLIIYIQSFERRQALASKAGSLIDGRGCEHIYEALTTNN